MRVKPSPDRPAPGFVSVPYVHEWVLEFDRARVWDWLCDPNTFIDGQIWPWEVEFLPNQDGPGDFRPGVYNAHTGPFLSFAGVLGEIDEGRYRDLYYFYGSYAVSFKLFRPTRLRFWLADHPDGTRLKLEVDTDVRSWAVGAWTWLMKRYWPLFGSFAHWGIRRQRSPGLTVRG